jgi:predicted CoA-substrate-specific enzyme activase
MEEGKVLGSFIVSTGGDIKRSTEIVIKEALRNAGLSREDLKFIISTGYGRNSVEFADRSMSEIFCHAKGVRYLIPSVRSIIDIGGQDSKAIELDENGRVRDFVMNDKCAAGTGRFLEVMAHVLEVGSVDKIGPLALKSKNHARISSTCTIFAETEVVSLRAQGWNKVDLLAGIHDAVASRVSTMARMLKLRDVVVFTGGVAKNPAAKRSLEEELGKELIIPDEPQLTGALGAALLAEEEVNK